MQYNKSLNFLWVYISTVYCAYKVYSFHYYCQLWVFCVVVYILSINYASHLD